MKYYVHYSAHVDSNDSVGSNAKEKMNYNYIIVLSW